MIKIAFSVIKYFIFEYYILFDNGSKTMIILFYKMIHTGYFWCVFMFYSLYRHDYYN